MVNRSACKHCRRKFQPNPHIKNQQYCNRKECQRTRKTEWQRKKMVADADYQENQKNSHRNWVKNNPDYFREYRKGHPEYCQIDLCSGAAKPVVTVKDSLDEIHKSIPVVVTDKFPNRKAFQEIEKNYKGRVTPIYDPVDATNVPPELKGFRTIFSAFHHFDWGPAQSIIRDAVLNRQGIGIFEYTDRNLLHYFHNFFGTIIVLFITPFIRPFTWKRLFFTYVIPLTSILIFFDGLVSCLRTYSTSELRELVRKVTSESDSEDYVWEIGQEKFMLLMNVTYLIGYPASP